MFAADGEAMLWGKNLTNGEAFGKIVSLAPVEIDLSLGQWNFYVTAWGGAGIAAPLAGKTICDFKSVLIDSGSTPEVVFDLTNSKCALGQFGPVNTVTVNTTEQLHFFPPGRIINCQDVNGPADETDWANCIRGFYSSYQIVVNEFGPGSVGGRLVSNCVAANATDGFQSDTVFANLPVGDGIAPFQYSVKGYIGSVDCDATANPTTGDPFGFREFVFLDGISGGSPGARVIPHSGNTCVMAQGQPNTAVDLTTCNNSAVLCINGSNAIIDGKIVDSSTCTASGGTAAAQTGSFINDGSAIKFGIIIPSHEVDVCTAERIYGRFAGGDGTPGRPYLICNANQFNNIDNDSVLMGKSFELVNDLDFNLATNSNCPMYGIAVNMNPIGGGIDPASNPPCMPIGSQFLFTGTFDGRGHAIKFARIRNGGLQGSGLFYTLSGATVKNISIIGSEFGVNSSLGALAGYCTNSTVDMIFIEDTRIEGEDDGNGNAYAGGLLGQSNGCIVSNIYAYDTEVEGRGSYVGGIVGSTSGGSFTDVDFFGRVESRPDCCAPGTYVGGIAGKSQSTINKAVVQGSIKGGSQIGGIAGAGSTATHIITNSYVFAHLESDFNLQGTDPGNVFLGGIVGNTNLGETRYNYFMGSISHQCKLDNLASCRIGTYAGMTTSTTMLTGANNQNYTQSEYSINNAGSLGGHNGTPIPWADFKNASHPNAFGSFDFATVWTHISGDIPRLARQDLECEQAINLASVPDQITAGRGANYDNAIRICNVDQMKQIKSNVNKIYRVAENFSLFGYLDSDAPAAFSGEFWGDDYTLFGGAISATNTTYGIFKDTTSSAKISDLTIAGFQNLSSGYNTQGALVGVNQGLIYDVSVLGAHVEGSTGVGLIAGINGENGVIKSVHVSGVVKGYNQVGGVAGKNIYASNKSGQILKAKSFVELIPSSPASQRAGGVVGENFGNMDQVMSGSKVMDNGTEYFDAVGGIAGKNLYDGGSTSLGTITNAAYSGYGDLRVKSATYVGGIVGVNEGPIDKTVSEGRVTKDIPGAIPATWGAVVGSDSGGNVSSSNYYMLDPFRYLTQVTTLASACFFDGTDTIVTLTGTSMPTGTAGPADYLRIDFDESSMIKVTSYTSPTVLVIAGADHCSVIDAGTNFDVYRFEGNNSVGTKLVGTAFYDIDSYCSGASLGDKYFTCTNGGFDITEEYQGMDGIGTQRVLDYYMAEMNGQPLPSHPIWVMEPNNNNPPRLFIKNND